MAVQSKGVALDLAFRLAFVWVIVGVWIVVDCGRAQTLAAGDEPPEGSALRSPRTAVCCVRLSEQLIVGLFGRSIETTEPVQDVILGVPVRGSADVQGSLTVDLKPDPQAAALLLCFEGTAASRTTGRKGPAVIRCTGCTRFRGGKRIEFDTDGGVRDEEAEISCQTQVRLDDVQTTLRFPCRQLVRCVARRRFRQKHHLAETIAARKSQTRIRSGFEERAGQGAEVVSKAVGIARPLVRESRGGVPPEWTLSTSRDALAAVLWSVEPQPSLSAVSELRPWECEQIPTPGPLADIWLLSSWQGADEGELAGALSAAAIVWQARMGQIDRGLTAEAGAANQQRRLVVDIQRLGIWTRIVLRRPPE